MGQFELDICVRVLEHESGTLSMLSFWELGWKWLRVKQIKQALLEAVGLG